MQRLSLILVIFMAASSQAQTSTRLEQRAQGSISQIQGTIKTPGLQKPVRVLRDRWGVAHIYAQNQHDLFFAQGYVVAQDRLFQMELWKRSGQGRLAEVLGPAALSRRDQFARLLSYRGDMKAEYESYSARYREILEAFTGNQCLHREPTGAGTAQGSAARVSTGWFRARALEAGGLPEPHGCVLHDRQCIRGIAARPGDGGRGTGAGVSAFRTSSRGKARPGARGKLSRPVARSVDADLVGSDTRIEFPQSLRRRAVTTGPSPAS